MPYVVVALIASDDRATQLERCFGPSVRHPRKRMYQGMRTRNDSEVTPFQLSVGEDRVEELSSGFDEEDSHIILLMRGARRECVAAASHMSVETMLSDVRERLKDSDLSPLIEESQRLLQLWRHTYR